MIPHAEKNIEEQIKELFERETFKMGTLPNSKNFDELLLEGENSIYRCSNLPVGGPKGAYSYGVIITINPTHSKQSTFSTPQIYIPDGLNLNPSDKSRGIFLRIRPTSKWLRLDGVAIEPITE